MNAPLSTFAKVRALHDSTDKPGEKSAAASRMESLARTAGMTVEQAKATIDGAKPKAAPGNFFEELFNTPEFRASHAEWEAERRARAAAAVKRFGSEEAVFADTLMEAALRTACAPLLGPGETWLTLHDLDGWGDCAFDKDMPDTVRRAASGAWPMPRTVAEAWAEFKATDEHTQDRCDLEYDYLEELFVRARQIVLAEMLDTIPAHSMRDVRARLDWMEFQLKRDFHTGPEKDLLRLATLRADIERLGARLRDLQARADG